MQARPLYKTSDYPTRLEVLADPHLLQENLAAAWRFAPQVAGQVQDFIEWLQAQGVI